MNKIECSVVKDLMPLYVDSLISDRTREIVEEHLKECTECSEYFKTAGEQLKIDISVDEKQLNDNGTAIVNKIKQAQDRIKYSFIIFAMIVAVGITLLSSGDMKIIPLIIIIPFMLRLFFKEGPVILLSALTATFVIALSSNGLSYGVLMLPLILICSGAGIIAAKAVQYIFSKNRG